MNEQLQLIPPEPQQPDPPAQEAQAENVSMSIQDAEMHLIGLKLGNDDPEGERDRLALEMGREALQTLRHVRMWVRDFKREYTAAELAELADKVEAIGRGALGNHPEPQEEHLS